MMDICSSPATSLHLPSRLPAFVSNNVAEKLYRTDLYGASNKIVVGRRAEQLVKPEAIAAIMDPKVQCCKRSGCLARWKAALGVELAEAVITTELYGYASMSETGRQQHFITKLKAMAVAQVATLTDGRGKHIVGE